MVVFSIRKMLVTMGVSFTCSADRLAKGYIGKSVTFKSRVSKHRRDAYAKKDGDWKSKSIWNMAIRRIGWHNLTVMILEFVPEEVSLEERERYWIAKLKTQEPKRLQFEQRWRGTNQAHGRSKGENERESMGMGQTRHLA